MPAVSSQGAARDAGGRAPGAEVAVAVDAIRPGTRGQAWAALMQRTFDFDVLACRRCGGRLRPVALIQQPEVIQRILRHLGLPTETPSPLPARAPPALLDSRTGFPDT
jgi:hypothetical protein